MNETIDTTNRLELLLFYLGDNKRRFGINVLKVKEVIPCPPLHQLPSPNSNILGVATLRGDTTPIIDLARAVKATWRALTPEQISKGQVITTEINRSHQGLWVHAIDKIIICDWKNITPPAKGTRLSSYTTGVTLIDGELIQLLDIEKVLAEILGIEPMHTSDLGVDQSILDQLKGSMVLVVDDSNMALKQTIQALDKMNLKHITAKDGKEALDILRQYENGEPLTLEPISMIISDIEMPEMDGYSFVQNLRRMSKFRDVHVLMHTSLNGTMNLQRAISCGANDVLTKFVPDELAHKIIEQLTEAKIHS